ncbi:MAG: dihydroneopterin aldolase [Spirochaetes bacterium]|nr:dihydroneopterin aldolase [Spirochaetota bacterium]
MSDKNLDKIYITDLALRCIIGINENERVEKQDIIINIVLFVDIRKAFKTDNIEDAVDYKVIKKKIIAFVEKSSFFLIEKLAEEISKVCLEDKKVKKVSIKVDKPQALRFARSVAVKITRFQK